MDRPRAVWTEIEQNLWGWGDWSICHITDGYHLIVSSGVEYGPFLTWDEVTQHAEDVRAD